MIETTNQAEQTEEGETIVSNRLFRILIIGFSLIFVGIIILALALVQIGSGSFGGVIFIGPIPIVFGAGPEANWLIIISIIISAVMVIGFIIFNKRSRRIIS